MCIGEMTRKVAWLKGCGEVRRDNCVSCVRGCDWSDDAIVLVFKARAVLVAGISWTIQLWDTKALIH